MKERLLFAYPKILKVLLVTLAFGISSATWAAHGGPGPRDTQVFDTSFAQEYSYSCLTGGCHEINATLVNEYAQSYMTHVMVKCNACHGTHTAAEVGQEKPNLTGYYPGIGPIGYVVGKDRCLVCHSSTENNGQHPGQPSECVNCHAPHVFPAGQGPGGP